jgi:hypothetical protein
MKPFLVCGSLLVLATIPTSEAAEFDFRVCPPSILPNTLLIYYANQISDVTKADWYLNGVICKNVNIFVWSHLASNLVWLYVCALIVIALGRKGEVPEKGS